MVLVYKIYTLIKQSRHAIETYICTERTAAQAKHVRHRSLSPLTSMDHHRGRGTKQNSVLCTCVDLLSLFLF